MAPRSLKCFIFSSFAILVSTALMAQVTVSNIVVPFKTTGTTSWTAPSGVLAANVLVVAGGGPGGSRDIAGGGGAGGVRFLPALALTPGTSYSVTVGAGGAGVADGGTPGSGGSSSFHTNTAAGGGYGAPYTSNPGAGGSGGGASGYYSHQLTGANGTSGQGFKGGNGNQTTISSSGGGGGAGAAGQNGQTNKAGDGGDGIYQMTVNSVNYNFYSLFGTGNGGHYTGGELWFGGGGGGTVHRSLTTTPGGAGGRGGGGNGLTTPDTSPNPGMANTGGGGGAAKSANATYSRSGAGGSGVVLVQYTEASVGQTGADQVITDLISGAVTILTKTGSNMVSLTNTNVFGGGANVAAGTLQIGDNGTSGSIGTSPVSIASGASFGVNRSDDLIFSNSISGAGSFVQNGDGTTTFSNVKTYTGGTVVNNGKLLVTATDGITGSVTVAGQGILELGTEFSSNKITSVTLNGGTLTSGTAQYYWVDNQSFPISFTGGTFSLGGAASGTGGNDILSPTITVNPGSPGRINRADGNTTATLRIRNSTSLTVNTLTNASLYIDLPITSSSSTNDGDGPGGLTKNGGGTLYLQSANLYTGTTTVNDGTLVLNGSLASTVSMTTQGVIAGTGNYAAVNLSGTISPAHEEIGILSATSVTLAADAQLNIGIGRAGSTGVPGVAGTDWDLLTVSGAINFGTRNMVINISGSPVDFNFLETYEWKIISAGSVSGFNASRFTVNSADLSVYTGNAVWAVKQVGNDILLTFTPRSLVLHGIGANSTTSDNYSILSGSTLRIEIGAPLDYLVVAGGGSGAGRDVGGGGGGGGVVSNLRAASPTSVLLPAGSYTVVVGAGGAGRNDNDGVNGGYSSFGPFKAIGGGGGGYYASYTAPLGGSGGGGGRQGYFGGPGVYGQGYSGGNGSNGASGLYDAGGGGGGAASAGQTAVKGTSSSTGKGGNGGAGISIDFTGTAQIFGGGGGGAPHRGASPSTMISGTGGIGGGGDAAVNNSSAPQSGQANTGGGGGAARSLTGNLAIGGNGGSGVVMVRYQGSNVATGGTISAGNNSASAYTIHSFLTTGSSTFTILSSALRSTYTGTFSGDGGIELNSPGTLIITQPQPYTGATTVTAGALNIQHAQGTGTTDGGVTVASGAALELEGGITVGAEALTINNTGISTGGALRNISGDNTWGGTVTLGAASRINSDAGTLTLNASNAITGSNINLTIGGAGNTTVSGTITTGSGTLTKDGNGTLTLTGANTYTGTTTVSAGTLILNKSGGTTIPVTNNVIVSGGILRISSNQTLNNVTVSSGTLIVDNGVTLTIEGAYTGGGTIDNAGTIVVKGSSSFPGSSTTVTSMSNLEINRSAGVSLDKSLTVSGTLTLTAGKLSLGSHDLTLAGSITGSNSSRYIATNGTGKVAKSLVNNTPFEFPVGNTSYNPITLTNKTASTDDFSVRVVDEVYSDGSSSGTTESLTRVKRTWDITKSNSSANSGNGVDLVFNWDPATHTSGALGIPAMYHYESGSWVKKSTSGNTVYNTTAGTLTFTGYTGSFSPFAVMDDVQALPVRWLSFSGKAVKGTVELNWSTATEQNNGYFEIERSADARQFSMLGRVNAAANPRVRNDYRYLDADPLQGKSFYRLKQIDLDGKFSYSSIIQINGMPISGVRAWSVPGSNKITVNIPALVDGGADVILYDGLGRLLQRRQVLPGRTEISVGTVLTGGMYFIRVQKGGAVLYASQFIN